MYFDPISAWLVALLFDGAEIIAERTKGGTVIEEYNRERIESRTRSLNSDIRRMKAKCELIMPEYTLNQIQRHIYLIKKDLQFQQGNGEITIDPDNQDYIIALLESCVETYHKDEERALTLNQSELAKKYRAKIESYQKVITDTRELKERQIKEREESRIRKEKQNENTGKVIILGVIIVVLIIIILS